MDLKKLRKILYIDASADDRALVRQTLGESFIVLEASTGISGIDLAIDTEPHLVLIDTDLPDLNGYEVATRLKTIIPDTPLVAVAPNELAMTTTQDFGLAVGFSGYISKPIEMHTLPQEIDTFLNGKTEAVSGATDYLIAYQSELAARLEDKVRELSSIDNRREFLNEQNRRMIDTLQRRQRLLENAAYVGKVITSILDLKELLPSAVNIICEEYNFYYAGIFLIDESEEWAVLRSGHGEAGKAMIAEGHRLKVDTHSMIGKAIVFQTAQISLDVGTEASHFKNPHLPETRSEMALPLIVKRKVLGAITVQSTEAGAFDGDDITALQSLADQLAIAINNARLLHDLDQANRELLRTKTFEAIATATGEAIHWVGNKAAPIPGSIERVKDDLYNLLALAQTLTNDAQDKLQAHPFWSTLQGAFEIAAANGVDLNALADELAQLPANRLSLLVGIESILEDLEIIEKSATTILNLKEDLIGPAREPQITEIHLSELLEQTVSGMGLPKGVIETEFEANLPAIRADARQVDRVFVNLIKNAWEALYQHANPKIIVGAHKSSEPGFIAVEVTDNGPGIPPEIMEKIWVSFFTTKKDRGGTGLGLSACMEIISQSGGKILVDSKVGEGTTFRVLLPIYET